MSVKVIQQQPAFTLSAYDYNGEGEEIVISWDDLKNAKVGDRWIVNSGNMVRDCCTYDSLEIIFKTDSYILAIHDWEEVGGYPNYPVSLKAELVLFSLNPQVEFEKELTKIVSSNK